MHDLHSVKHDDLLDRVKQMDGAIVVYRPVGGIGDAVMICPAAEVSVKTVSQSKV